MKKILFAVAVVLASCATAPARSASVPSTNGSAPNSPPAVSAQRETTYQEALPISIKSFYPNDDPSGTQTIRYNPQGLLVLQETFNGNGVLIESRTGKAKAELWRITVTNAQNGEIASFEDRKLGSRGELLVQTFLNSKEIPQAANEFTYDAQGHRTLWLAKTGVGDLQARTVYTYDKRGNNTKTQVYDAGGSLTNVFQSTYDEQSQIVSRQGFDASGTLAEQTNFTWKDGRKVKEETTKPLLRTIEYSYDDKSAPSGIVSSVRGKVVERQILDYQWFTKTKIAP